MVFALETHKATYGRWPDLFRPRRFSDRLLKIMLSKDGHSDLRARITDKEFAKEFIKEKAGDGLTARTYAVLRSKEEVDACNFPENCAIKATHDSGSVILRRSGGPIDRALVKSWLDRNFYWRFREPNYRLLTPKIIVEELLASADGRDLPDYKVFCIKGVPAFIQVDVNRFTNHQRDMFSPRWRKLAFANNYPNSAEEIPSPRGLAEMLPVARTISAGFTFLRVDFYQLDDRIVVGELTNFPQATLVRFMPDSASVSAGALFDNPNLDVEEMFGVTQ